jgi:predicted acylesterase/phospholipase RssA
MTLITIIISMTIKHLVISGGGPTMFQSLGAIQYLEQHKYIDLNNIETIYGTSAGAIIGVFISLKYDWTTINDYVIKRPWHKIFSIKAQHIFDAYTKKGLFDNTTIEKCLKPLFDAKDISMEITMKDFFKYCGIEIHMFTFEINNFESIDISYKTHPDLQLIKALHMSCSLPVIMSPVFIENKCYIDGGINCNYPLNKCIEANKNVDEIVGFNNDYNSDDNTSVENIQSENIISENTISENTISEKTNENIINENSTILDFILGLFFKIIRSMQTDTKQSKIQNEIVYKADLISVNILKNTLYSSETRQKLLQIGIDAAKKYLDKIEKYKEK